MMRMLLLLVLVSFVLGASEPPDDNTGDSLNNNDSHLNNGDPINSDDSFQSGYPLNSTSGDIMAKRKCFPDPSRYIVQFRDGTGPAVRTKLLQELKAAGDVIGYDDLFLGFAMALKEDEVLTVREHPDVETVEQDHHCTGSYGSIRQANSPWNLGRISHRRAGATWFDYDSSAGKGTCAYVLDTGVDVTHPEFGGRAKHLASFVGHTETDGHGHGTHIAAIIAGTTYGVAKQARIYGVKVLNDACGGSIVDVIQGLEHVFRHMRDDQTARQRCPLGFLVNLAISYPPSGVLNLAVSQLVQANAFVAVAAGNENGNAADYSPQMVQGACVVGGTDRYDRPLFDLTGSSSDNWGTNWGPRIDVFAPGADIKSAWPYGATAIVSGTSQAAPQVVGMAAVMMSGGEKARGTALCNRIKALASRNAIVGLQPRSENRLAFMSATPLNTYASNAGQYLRDQSLYPSPSWEFKSQELPPWCTSFDDLLVFLSVSSTSRASEKKSSSIKVWFPGVSSTSQVIGSVGPRGQTRWQRVNMASVFGAATFPLDHLTQVAVMPTPPLSGCNIFASSPWRVKRIFLRARCTRPPRGIAAPPDSIWLHTEKPVQASGPSFSRWICRSSSRSPHPQLAIRDWKVNPACSHFRQISVRLTMADEAGAGTDNDIVLRVGTSPQYQIRIAHQPDRGSVHFLDVPMQAVFGQPFIRPNDLPRMAVMSIGSATDYSFPQEIRIKAVCYGDYSVVHKMKLHSDVWLGPGGEWVLDVRPEAWTVTWATRAAAGGGTSSGQETERDEGEDGDDDNDPRAMLVDGVDEAPIHVPPHVVLADF